MVIIWVPLSGGFLTVSNLHVPSTPSTPLSLLLSIDSSLDSGASRGSPLSRRPTVRARCTFSRACLSSPPSLVPWRNRAVVPFGSVYCSGVLARVSPRLFSPFAPQCAAWIRDLAAAQYQQKHPLIRVMECEYMMWYMNLAKSCMVVPSEMPPRIRSAQSSCACVTWTRGFSNGIDR